MKKPVLVSRLFGGLAGLLFIAMAPILFLCLEGLDKVVALPVLGFGVLFFVFAFRAKSS